MVAAFVFPFISRRLPPCTIPQNFQPLPPFLPPYFWPALVLAQTTPTTGPATAPQWELAGGAVWAAGTRSRRPWSNPATIPLIRPGEQPQHKAYLDRAKQGNIDVVFLGDSITDFFTRDGADVWKKYWVPLNAVDFGVSGDRTQNILGRVDGGELDGFKAKCIILMIGTNNLSTNRNTNEETLAGLKLVVADIRKHQPDAKLLLMSITPRGTSNDRAKAVNAEMAKWADDKNIFYMDIFDKFMKPDGTQNAEVMNGTIHFNAKGYEVWSEAIVGQVKELLAQP